ncbi:hypothetical protein XENTR_v10006279 [Xenopus tropicalis]|uniref:Cellular repressor of E1A stimulated genes 2 n=1 Tax=Xenopus tropicalis TaxID=8364 RepID=A0A6I8Q597_XENTR|nr:protein CREG2 [Xenopus tropicalis]KAE8625458.1 hypothetical protein XENTR_v10006279 [Xenopus tropicalis]|eukprot:XP_002934553.1 PREDICTED: protein CREG2 [Xenopus tropicalis]
MSVCFFPSRIAAFVCLLCVFACTWLPHSRSYVIVNSVSWSVTNEVEEELDSSSTEDALPALLEDTISIWKQSYPASAFKEDRETKTRPASDRSKQISSPSRMFSYKRESNVGTESPSPPQAAVARHQKMARSARVLAHHSKWGFLATVSTQDLIVGVPFGHVLLISDGPIDNGTGDPFIYASPKASFISDLLKNPVASLTIADLDADVCKSITEEDDPQTAVLTLTGQMVTVQPEEVDFAKKALFSRHPVMRKLSPIAGWLLMKMKTEHVHVTDCYGKAFTIKMEDYYRA